MCAYRSSWIFDFVTNRFQWRCVSGVNSRTALNEGGSKKKDGTAIWSVVNISSLNFSQPEILKFNERMFFSFRTKKHILPYVIHIHNYDTYTTYIHMSDTYTDVLTTNPHMLTHNTYGKHVS